MRHFFEYLVVVVFGFFCRRLTISGVQRVGDWMGNFWYKRLKFRKEVVFNNLRKVFPEKSENDIQKIARATFRQLSKSAIELFRIPLMENKDYLHSVVKIVVGKELFSNAIKSGKGAILVSGHFGNFEMVGAALGALGFPVATVQYEQHNKRIYRMIEKYHQSMGIQVIRRQNARKELTEAFQQGKIVGFLADQDAGERGIFVKFFGIDSSTAVGPAAYALKMGVPIICGYTIRQTDGSHHAFLHPLNMSGLTGIRDRDIQILTQRHTLLLEEYIRKYPDHWYWVHRRWKRQPTSGERKTLQVESSEL